MTCIVTFSLAFPLADVFWFFVDFSTLALSFALSCVFTLARTIVTCWILVFAVLLTWNDDFTRHTRNIWWARRNIWLGTGGSKGYRRQTQRREWRSNLRWEWRRLRRWSRRGRATYDVFVDSILIETNIDPISVPTFLQRSVYVHDIITIVGIVVVIKQEIVSFTDVFIVVLVAIIVVVIIVVVVVVFVIPHDVVFQYLWSGCVVESIRVFQSLSSSLLFLSSRFFPRSLRKIAQETFVESGKDGEIVNLCSCGSRSRRQLIIGLILLLLRFLFVYVDTDHVCNWVCIFLFVVELSVSCEFVEYWGDAVVVVAVAVAVVVVVIIGITFALVPHRRIWFVDRDSELYPRWKRIPIGRLWVDIDMDIDMDIDIDIVGIKINILVVIDCIDGSIDTGTRLLKGVFTLRRSRKEKSASDQGREADCLDCKRACHCCR